MSEKEHYVGKMRNASLHVIADSRHASHWDQWQTFNRLVLDYLREYERQPAAG